MAWHRADQGHPILGHSEDACPTVLDPLLRTGQLADEVLEVLLNQRRRRLLGGLLLVQRLVAEAARDEPAVGSLLPVVETMSGVMRAREQAPLERRGDDHLAPCRQHHGVELRDEAVGVPVGRDHDLISFELVE